MIEFASPGYNEVSTKEWIVTNGLGGYASSTIAGANTRRYHGILVGSLNPPTERRVFVSKIEEMIYIDHIGVPLSSNQYPDTIFPEGYKHISSFDRDPVPTVTFTLGQVVLRKSIFMVHGSNTTVVEYKNASKFSYKLWVNPLYVYRDFHATEQERHDHHYHVKFMGHTHAIQASDESEVVFFKHTHGIFTESRTWNKNLEFHTDRSRGHEFTEDVYSVGYVEHEIEAGQSIFFMFSLDHDMLSEIPDKLKKQELKRLKDLVSEPTGDEFLEDLLRAGDQFIVTRRSTNSTSVLAGYHWFTDWGRDSMIAVRGLCIATGKQDEARSVINTFLSYLNHGLIPNRFPDYTGDQLEYNTIDATLWLFIAVYEYDEKFKDDNFLKKILPKLTEIIKCQINGTLHNIKVLENGLLSGGSEDIQITWMDAKLGDMVFTPRNGCAVEINALWYNSLKIYEHITNRLGEKKNKTYFQLATKLKKEFKNAFWNNEGGYLNDVVNGEKKDLSIRPNQIFAVSLPFSLLTKKEEKLIVKNIEEHLLTPYGLRTLDQNNIAFRSLYQGDLMSRDSAYHQGTTWPFLMPEYYLAYLKVNGNNPKTKKLIEQQLTPLKEHFYTKECIHGISEVFDGLNPLEGKGCIHQAWSISNLILLILKADLKL